MADREKIIKGLEELQAWLKHLQTVGYHGDIPEYRERMVSDALALLREQEPVEPDHREVWVGSNGAFVWEVRCGACGCGITKNDRWCTKYCPQCGRKVKWDD